MKRLSFLLTASLIALAATPIAAQQNLFAPRLVINDRAVTHYEIEQRKLFLQLLRAPGDVEKTALDGLIDDRLRMQEAKLLGLTVTPETLKEGMEEFAARGNMTAEQFIAALGQAGVQAETFRDFVEAGLVWREVVRAKYAPFAKVTEAEIDRAIEGETRKAALRVALTELIIPAEPGQEAAALDLARQIKAGTHGEGAFAAAVARHSASASRERGGRLDWIPLANLPPALAPVVLALGPGEVSDPVPLPGGVALFQLRGVEETAAEAPVSVSVEYARLRLPADAASDAEIARLRSEADTCKDIFGLAPGLTEDQFQLASASMAELPQDLGLAIARLDPGESVILNRAGAQEMVMLCARMPVSEEPISRDTVRSNLVNQRLAAQADLYLKTLRANAIIREP